jgi:hypothetical protein
MNAGAQPGPLAQKGIDAATVSAQIKVSIHLRRFRALREEQSMVQNLTEALFVEDGSQPLRFDPTSGGPFFECGRQFRFQLCRKRAVMGEVIVDQFWLPTQGLYGERKKESPNRQAVIDFYWALCWKHATVIHEDIQQSYILANLLPHARSNGARRVFADAGLARSKSAETDKRSMPRQLESMLQESQHKELTEVEFRDRTADLLGPPHYDQAVGNCYRDFEADLLGECYRDLIAQGQRGLLLALEKWRDAMQKLGRRRGHQLEKQVLDILSYEARAAFHRCYSATWDYLLPHLAEKYKLTKESVLFHRLWHFDIQRGAAETDRARFHLFHGSIFSLHPACGNFMLTESGPALVGAWLADHHSVPKYQRLLHGLLVALHQYAERHEVYALLRRRDGAALGGGDWTEREEHVVERRSRRRRSR